jgi:hypothetical protein
VVYRCANARSLASVKFALVVALFLFIISSGLAASPPLDARHSAFVAGNASPKIAQGTRGTLAPAAVFPRVGLIILRNNTARPVEGIRPSAIVRTRRGRLLGHIEWQEMARPYHVEPGEIALATFDFNCGISVGGKLGSCHRNRWPVNAKFVVSATAGPASPITDDRRDWTVKDFTLESGRFSGTAVNPIGVGPVLASVACFSTSGKALFEVSQLLFDQSRTPQFNFALKDSRLSESACPVFLATARG